ncbi:MAG: leucine-rich repeat protein [Ruminococcus sp.]|nr:leucine-rich repeat protein [Ruminococcus sp.]
METRKKFLKAAAFIAALTLTAGYVVPVNNSTGKVSPATAYADDSYTEGNEGVLSYRKYTDHIEIVQCDMSATSAEIPETIEGLPVTVIGMYAFEIQSLESITIPDTVTEIGNWAFAMNSKLKSVTIPDSVEKIGIRAFEMCSSLEEVNFPDHLVEISSNAFSETPWLEAQRKKSPLVIVNGDLIDAQTAEGDVVIPSEVKYLSPSAFARNSKLTSVVIPASIDKVCDNAFFYCDNLTSAEINGAELIDSMSFDGCEKLKELKISGKLKKIVDYAFADIPGNATITFYGSKEMWEKVDKPSEDKFLNNATMIFDENHVDPEPEQDPETENLLGDANLDTKVTVADAVAILQSIGNRDKYELKPQGKINADVDGVEGVTANDALTIQKLDAKVIEKFPAAK